MYTHKDLQNYNFSSRIANDMTFLWQKRQVRHMLLGKFDMTDCKSR